MARRSTEGQAGFVITLELVLIFTILGLGVMVGIVAIRNALFKFFLHKKAAEIYVVDSGTPQKVLGKAFDLDEHEAPRIQLADLGVDFGGVEANRRVILGVRDDRFTTRHRVFYENSFDCGVTTTGEGAIRACIVRNGDETGDNRGVGIVNADGVVESTGAEVAASGRIANAGGIGYLYPMQGGPSYGVGRDVDTSPFRVSFPGLPGTLYRETDDDCTPANLRSVWTSQYVTEGPLVGVTLPCEPLPPTGATVDAAKCPDGRNGANVGDPCLPPADSRCVTTGGGGAGTCSNGGANCNSNLDCLFCVDNPAIACTLAGSQCATGTCSVTPQACATDADCPGGTGTCTTSGASCTTDAECNGLFCSNNGGQTGGSPLACTVATFPAASLECPNNPFTRCRLFTDETCTISGGETCNGGSGTCGGTCNLGGGLTCSCPPGWVDYGANCCPPGTVEGAPGQCTLVNNGQIAVATPVKREDGTTNALSIYEPPFYVNFPVEIDATFQATEPGGFEGAPPGPVIPGGADVDSIDYATPPAGGESGPP